MIAYGIESGNQDVLDFYNKRITLNQIKLFLLLEKQVSLVMRLLSLVLQLRLKNIWKTQ